MDVRYVGPPIETCEDGFWPRAPVDRRWRNDRSRGEADGRLRRADDREGSRLCQNARVAEAERLPRLKHRVSSGRPHEAIR